MNDNLTDKELKRSLRIADISAIISLFIGLAIVIFTYPHIYRYSMAFTNKIVTTEKEYVNIKITDIPDNNKDTYFYGLDDNDLVRINTYSVKLQNIHLGDNIKVKKYKSWLSNSTNKNGWLYYLEDKEL